MTLLTDQVAEGQIDDEETTYWKIQVQTKNNNLDSKLVRYSFTTSCEYHKSDRGADYRGRFDYSRSDHGGGISGCCRAIIFGVIVIIGLIIAAIATGTKQWIATIILVLTIILLIICMMLFMCIMI
eukprot:398350_1